MTITVNGNDYPIVFKMGVMRRIGELTKKDPFTLNADFSKPSEVYKLAFTIVQGALLASKIPVTEAALQEAMDDWQMKEAKELINEFIAFYRQGEPEEDKTGAQ